MIAEATRGPARDIPRQVRALERQIGALRQQARGDLVRTLAATIGDRAFNAGEVIEHARLVSRPLRVALAAADMRSARRLGKFLRAMQGRDLDGFEVARLGHDNGGVIWSVTVRRTVTPTLAPPSPGGPR